MSCAFNFLTGLMDISKILKKGKGNPISDGIVEAIEGANGGMEDTLVALVELVLAFMDEGASAGIPGIGSGLGACGELLGNLVGGGPGGFKVWWNADCP